MKKLTAGKAWAPAALSLVFALSLAASAEEAGDGTKETPKAPPREVVPPKEVPEPKPVPTPAEKAPTVPPRPAEKAPTVLPRPAGKTPTVLPRPGEELPVVRPRPGEELPMVRPGSVAGPSPGEPAPRIEPAPRVGPAPPAPDLVPEQPAPPPRWVRRATAREIETRQKLVRVYFLQGLRAYRAHRYTAAINACDRALKFDSENLAVQRLRYAAERARQDHRLALDAERELFRDQEALAQVHDDSQLPVRPPDVPRPRLPLREEMPKSEGLRRMEEFLNQRVSMNFVDTDLNYVLQTLFKIAGVDVMADTTVLEGKTLTMHLDNAPLRDILDFIKSSSEDIDYTVTENAVWITSPEKPRLIPRSYPLSRGLVGQGEFTRGARRTTSGQSSGRTGGRTGGRTPRGGGSSARGTSGGTSGGAAGETHIETILTWVEGWEDEWPQGSQWILDKKTGTLVVLTTPEMHTRIEEILDIMDVTPVQILVKTRFLEVESDDTDEAGLGFLFLDSRVDDATVDELVGESIAMQQGAVQFRKVYGLGDGDRLAAELTLLMQRKNTKVLSAPHIIAMNNTPATIDISKSFSYASQYQSTNTTVIGAQDGGYVPTPTAFLPSSFEDVEVGFFMEFVPSVGRDMKTIVLDLHVRVDEVKDLEQFENTDVIIPTDAANLTQMPSIRRPIIDAREFQTRLVVEDGGVVVIGGLLKKNHELLRRRVPVLGDIPLLGLLFRYVKRRTVTSNLVIIVEAEIVSPAGQRYAKEGEQPGWGEAAPELGIRSFGGAPVKSEWIRDLAPEIEREVMGR